jgi:hypothetical protein
MLEIRAGDRSERGIGRHSAILQKVTCRIRRFLDGRCPRVSDAAIEWHEAERTRGKAERIVVIYFENGVSGGELGKFWTGASLFKAIIGPADAMGASLSKEIKTALFCTGEHRLFNLYMLKRIGCLQGVFTNPMTAPA